jgi:kynurenine 3-monooxygenase
MYLKDKDISIIGAGLVGSLLSIYLSKQGSKVSIYERRKDMRLDTTLAGRSINLSLSKRGINALSAVGINDEIMTIAMPMYHRAMHSANGDITIQPYGKKDEAIFSVSRATLNIILMDLAEKHNVKINFEAKCQSIDFDRTKLTLLDHDVNSDLIFAADGAGSVVRKQMKSTSLIKSSEDFIDCGYKELTIPSNSDGTHKIDNQSLHIWPRKSYMIIALPNLDGTFTCTLFFPMRGKNSFESLVSELDIMHLFNNNFQDLVPLIPDISSQYFANPTASLGLVNCYPWSNNNTVLIGDSCHATVPFYGQGMNSGFEDCFLLNEFINTSKSIEGFKKLLPGYLKARKLDTDAMQSLSMENFIVMRDKTADQKFLLQKKIERWFSEKNPTKWTPLYSMVSFSNIPYSKALSIGEFQEKVMEQVMKIDNLDLIDNSLEIESLIMSLLKLKD